KEMPAVTAEDRHYLLDAADHMFPGLDLTDSSIESTWAGFRPLILEEGKDPSDISSKDEIWEADSNLITIAGGKLTGYRHLAEESVDVVVMRIGYNSGLKFKPSDSNSQPISGGGVGVSENFRAYVRQMAYRAPSFGLTFFDGRYI